MASIRVGICDDHPVFVQGLAELLTNHSDYSITIKAFNGSTLLEKLKTRTIEVLLLDLKMPELDGLQLTQIIRKRHPEVKIIILSMNSEAHYIVHAMSLGANGYLLKHADLAEIKKAINAVMNTGNYHPDYVSAAMAKGLESIQKNEPQFNPSIQFSARDIEILRYLALGHSNAEIADMLSISVRTVEGYRKQLLDKARVKNTASLIAFAYRNKIIE